MYSSLFNFKSKSTGVSYRFRQKISDFAYGDLCFEDQMKFLKADEDEDHDSDKDTSILSPSLDAYDAPVTDPGQSDDSFGGFGGGDGGGAGAGGDWGNSSSDAGTSSDFSGDSSGSSDSGSSDFQ